MSANFLEFLRTLDGNNRELILTVQLNMRILVLRVAAQSR